MKKILFSAMAVVLSLGLMGAAFAYFSDTATSSGNTFTAGTIDLDITSGPGGSSVTFADMKPGDIVSGSITVENKGTLDGNLYGRTTYTLTGDSDLGLVLNVTSWQDPTMGSSVNPGMTLRALVNQTHPIDLNADYSYSGLWMAYGTLAAGTPGTFSMTVEFDTGAGNDYQGDGIDLTWEFVLTQQ